MEAQAVKSASQYLPPIPRFESLRRQIETTVTPPNTPPPQIPERIRRPQYPRIEPLSYNPPHHSFSCPTPPPRSPKRVAFQLDDPIIHQRARQKSIILYPDGTIIDSPLPVTPSWGQWKSAHYPTLEELMAGEVNSLRGDFE